MEGFVNEFQIHKFYFQLFLSHLMDFKLLQIGVIKSFN